VRREGDRLIFVPEVVRGRSAGWRLFDGALIWRGEEPIRKNVPCIKEQVRR